MIRTLHPALLALTLLASPVGAQGATTLREAAGAAGLHFGLALSSALIRDTAGAYAAAARTQFGMAVCENEMKFESIRTPTGGYRFDGGDAVAGFAATHGMKMRGNALITYSDSRPATGPKADRDTFLTLMRDHIASVGGHFRDKVLEWDVLKGATSIGDGTFWRAIGEDYPDSAMAISRRVLGTSGYLYYNEHGADGINAKSTQIHDLAKRWQAAKVPVDGFGFACHLESGFGKEDISANIKRFGELGMRVSLTEVDIRNGTAQDWGNLMAACLENFNCVSFVTWGLTDASSWIGSNCGCLLYQGTPPAPKAALIQALLDAFAKADPATTAKRKVFSALPPGSLGWNGLGSLRPMMARRDAGIPFGGSTLRIFPMPNGRAADALGRNRDLPPPASSGHAGF